MSEPHGGLRFDSAQWRIEQALRLHEPVRVCLKHHISDPNHDCGGPWLYRCATCARTREQPCATWRALTGKERP